MPRRNGTGPLGRGVMTGWGLGYCDRGYGYNYDTGLGLGFRRGFGRRNLSTSRYNLTEKEILENEIDLLESRIDILNKELESL